METESLFSKFIKPIRRAINERGFSEPTEPQVKAIPLIMEGKNVLLIAPTGTGKTESAFLPILDNLIKIRSNKKKASIKALYITPLRALNRDLLDRLGWWCKRLDVKLAVRHGDTEERERRAQAIVPPDLLITTPETLQAIMPGRIMKNHLKSIKWVIVDEVHELATEKRGSQLALGLERLRNITERDFQLIGLSATIGTPDEVAKFLVGQGRSCDIVQVPVAKSMELKILYPRPSQEDYKLAERLYTYPEVAARLRIMREFIDENASVLLFTNTRSVAETLSSRFRLWDIDMPIGIHHGSLSKISRTTTEKDLKEGRLQGIVCTSSLELGIDVGSLTMVIQYNSPRQVTRLVQRVGRSGHRVGGIAKGVIITQDSDDALEAMVIAHRALIENLEPAPIPKKPLDALTHQIVGLMMQKTRWSFDEVLEIFRKAHPYKDLTEDDLISVLRYMHTRSYPFAHTFFGDRFFQKPRRSKELYNYYFQNLSMIPDEKQFIVIEEKTDEPIGVLDEAFVAENGEIGTKFIVRGSVWKILQVYQRKIYVKAEEDPRGAIPSWVGEEIPVPFEIANEVGGIRRRVEEMLNESLIPEEVAEELSKIYPSDPQTMLRAIAEISEQVEVKLPVPTDRMITIEKWGDLIIVHCCFGLLVNRTLSRVMGLFLSEKAGHPVGIQQDPYRIIFQSDKLRTTDVEEILRDLTQRKTKDIATQAFIKGGLFKIRFLHVAKKFGAISKDADLSDVSLTNIIKSYEDTVVYDEAVNMMLYNDADIEKTQEVLRMIESGQIDIEILDDETLSPIARIGIEEINRMTDLIAPSRMRHILIESVRNRLMNETRSFVCTECWSYADTFRIKDLPEQIVCKECGSTKIGMLDESLDEVQRLCDRELSKMKKLSDKKRASLKKAMRTAELISEYGLTAAVVLVVRSISILEAKAILREEHELSDKLFELIIESEKRAMKRRFLGA